MLAEPCTLRRADAEDAHGIARLARPFIAVSDFGRWFACDQERIEGALRDLVSHEQGIGLVAEVDNWIVGAIVGRLTSPWFDPTARVAAELGWWVDPEHRGHGAQLLREFESWARDQKADCVALSDLLHTNAAPAGTLLERHGYELVERSWVKGLVVG
jgi:GNAT superfamily N-acetyltransferase